MKFEISIKKLVGLMPGYDLIFFCQRYGVSAEELVSQEPTEEIANAVRKFLEEGE